MGARLAYPWPPRSHRLAWFTGRGSRVLSLIDDIKDLIEHDAAAAGTMLRGMVEALPGSVEARHLLAQFFLRRLDFTEALAAAQAVVQLDPRHTEALHMVGYCRMQLADTKGALVAYQAAFKAVSSAPSLRFIGLLSHRLGRLDMAIAAYERLLSSAQATSAEIPIATQGLIRALRDAGRPLEADHYSFQLLERHRRERMSLSSKLTSRNSSEDFHAWSSYADKAGLARALNRDRGRTGPVLRAPETFVLPDDRLALETLAYGATAPPLFIVKPIRGSGGQGIFVTPDIGAVLHRTDVVVQRYIERPYLVEGRKGHARIYGLVTEVSPLRAYVYTQGIVRFAPEIYAPSAEAPGSAAMHVTNTALHLDHPDLEVSRNPMQEDVGAIWSLAAYLRRMTAQGIDGQAVFDQIKALTTGFIRMLEAEGLFAGQAAAPKRSYMPKLFGLDVLIDADGAPWLIEMQLIPAARGSALVERLNGAMFETIFAMSQGLLANDATSAEDLARLRTDPAAIAARELEIETANRGLFVELDLSPRVQSTITPSE